MDSFYVCVLIYLGSFYSKFPYAFFAIFSVIYPFQFSSSTLPCFSPLQSIPLFHNSLLTFLISTFYLLFLKNHFPWVLNDSLTSVYIPYEAHTSKDKSQCPQMRETYNICLSGPGLPHSKLLFPVLPILVDFIFLMSWIIFHYVNIPHFHYIFIS